MNEPNTSWTVKWKEFYLRCLVSLLGQWQGSDRGRM